MVPLKENAKSKTPFVTDVNVKSLFSDVQNVFKLSTKVVSLLQKQSKEWTKYNYQEFGDTFKTVVSR